ncbi:MAG: FHA domain-containing protein [Bdellovibrionota bacterium]
MNIKLLVISGPNRGATYFLEEGETTLGRGTEANVVLASTQVSKKHFALACSHGKAELKDLGSSNGTFVNGVLTKRKLLANHDRISVGPFVMEIILPEIAVKAIPLAGAAGGPLPGIEASEGQFKMEEEQPTSLVGKYWKKFDDTFLPVMYDFYEKLDYPTLSALMFAVYVVLSLGFAVYPVLQHSREEVMREAEHQAEYISEQVAYLNRQSIVENKEGALITDFAEKEAHVKEVVVANMEGRILAPGNRLNEAYNNPTFLRYKGALEKNPNIWGKTKNLRDAENEQIYSFTPVMVLSKTKGIQVPGAIATVIYSTSSLALDPGTVSSVYLEALFWSAVVGVVFLYLLYKVTHKPLEKLSEDMDKVLKGDAESVEKKYKNDVIDNLIDNVNAALSRIPKADGSKKEEEQAGDTEGVIINNMMRSIEYLAMNAKHPMMMVDSEARVTHVSPTFEELTGIRGATGEMLEAVSRDESFPALIKEMIGKAPEAGAEGVHEDYEFNAGTHKIHGYAISGLPGKIEGFLFLFEKLGD